MVGHDYLLNFLFSSQKYIHIYVLPYLLTLEGSGKGERAKGGVGIRSWFLKVAPSEPLRDLSHVCPLQLLIQ